MGEPLIDQLTGKAADVPTSQVGDLIASGQYVPAQGARVPVVVDDGTVQTIAAEDLKSALAVGWTVATGDEVQRQRDAALYETTSAQVRTAGESALRGLTLGLSDKALVELGVDPAGMLKRKELNPVISTGSEIGAALAPLLLSGGSSAAAQGAGALARTGQAVRTVGAIPRAVAATGSAVQGGLRAVLGEGILARGAAAAGAGAVEGGLYGLGQAVSESALRDIPLASERIVAHVGTGALFGGVAGGVLGSSAAAIDKLIVPKVKELFTVERLQSLVDRAGLRQWAQGRGKGAFKKLRRDFGNDAEATIGRTVRDEGLADVIAQGSTWDEIHAITKGKLGVSGRRIGDDLRAIDAAAPESASQAVLRVARRGEDSILDPLQRSGLRSDKVLAQRMRREFGWLWLDEGAIKAELVEQAAAGGKKLRGAALQKAAEQRAMQMRAEFTPSFEKLHQLRARIDDVAFPKGATDPTPYQKALQQLRGVVEDEITSAADAAAAKIGGNLAQSYSSNKLRYRALKWLTDAAENNAASELSNRTVSLTDNIWGSAVTASTLVAALSGDMSALGGVMLSTFAGAGASVLNKYLREQGQGLAARMGEKVLGLMRASESTAKEADRAVTKFFAPGKAANDIVPIAAASAGESKLEPVAARFERASAKFQNFMTAPEAQLARALGDTDMTAPGVAREVRSVAMRAAAYLDEKLPRRRVSASDVQHHLDKRPRLSDQEMSKWMRYADAVENPRKAVAAFAEGKLTREGADALRVVYPRIHTQLVEQVEQKIAQAKERLPYQQIVQLSILLGKPLHPSLDPNFIAACQAVHADARDKQQAKPPSGRGSPDFSSGQATHSQRIEGAP